MEAVVGGDNARWTILGLARRNQNTMLKFLLLPLIPLFVGARWKYSERHFYSFSFNFQFPPSRIRGPYFHRGSKSSRSEVVPSFRRKDPYRRDMFRILVPLLFLICLSTRLVLLNRTPTHHNITHTDVSKWFRLWHDTTLYGDCLAGTVARPPPSQADNWHPPDWADQWVEHWVTDLVPIAAVSFFKDPVEEDTQRTMAPIYGRVVDGLRPEKVLSGRTEHNPVE